MKHIYLNLKRFDVPVDMGGVNRLAPIPDWAGKIVSETQDALKKYDPSEVEFAMYFPEIHILNAAAAKNADSPIQVGCQSVYREDTAVGGNFGAFTRQISEAIHVIGDIRRSQHGIDFFQTSCNLFEFAAHRLFHGESPN